METLQLQAIISIGPERTDAGLDSCAFMRIVATKTESALFLLRQFVKTGLVI